ncbi:glycosyltransferase family 2 protein [Aeromonas caviae]|uniref:glycosyltransferase family 2 protein n=1 Tax=Aeromonas caviae TaxID=648 RepID=UPI0029D9EED1|nr:glycosyltransferase family 2 protein [Aeromonas caviae]MDX7762176.1 glycosyltransferase family 2 protein [Aeromonas caviae]
MCKKISIVVPFYERSKNFSDIYKTINNQTFDNWELIIVDDGSSDHELLHNFVSQVSDSRVKLILLSKNVGGAAARNRGIIEATGDYIAFLDSDDLWCSKKLEAQFEYIEKSDEDVLFSNVDIVNKNGELLERKEVIYKNNEDVSEYIFVKDGLIQTSSLFMKTECAQNIMFNPLLKRHQDYDFVLRLYHHGYKFHKIAESLVFWIQDDGTVFSRGASYRNTVDWLRTYKKYMTRLATIKFASKIMFWMARYNSKRAYYIFDVISILGLYDAIAVSVDIMVRLSRKIVS